MTITEELIQDIINEIANISFAIRNKRFGEFTIEQLEQRKEVLQQKLNDLLKQKGILTETEADKIYEELRLQKEKSLKSKLGKGYTAFVVFGVVIAAGLYFAFKKKK